MHIGLDRLARVSNRLVLSIFLTLSIVLVGLTLIVGAGAILMVRAYIAIGERMADLGQPDMDTSPRGIFDAVRELAAGPGVHHAMFWCGAALALVGFVLTIIRVVSRRMARRLAADEYARAADHLRRERDSGRG